MAVELIERYNLSNSMSRAEIRQVCGAMLTLNGMSGQLIINETGSDVFWLESPTLDDPGTEPFFRRINEELIDMARRDRAYMASLFGTALKIERSDRRAREQEQQKDTEQAKLESTRKAQAQLEQSKSVKTQPAAVHTSAGSGTGDTAGHTTTGHTTNTNDTNDTNPNQTQQTTTEASKPLATHKGKGEFDPRSMLNLATCKTPEEAAAEAAAAWNRWQEQANGGNDVNEPPPALTGASAEAGRGMRGGQLPAATGH